MTEETITEKDITCIMAALKSWQRDIVPNVESVLAQVMLIGDGTKASMFEALRTEKAKHLESVKERDEIVILLQAKFLRLRSKLMDSPGRIFSLDELING